MTDTVKRLYSGTPASSPIQPYTVPTGFKTILSEVLVYNHTASSGALSLKNGSTLTIFSQPTAATSSYAIPLKSVLESGTVLTISSFGNGANDIYLSGIEIPDTEPYKRLSSATLTTTPTTLYTVPTNTKTIVTELLISSRSQVDETFNISLGGLPLLNNGVSLTNGPTKIYKLHTVLEAGATIIGSTVNANACDIYISGVELT